MNSLALGLDDSFARARPDSSHATSNDLETIEASLHQAQSARTEDRAGWQRLAEVYAECSQSGWDGHNARPITVGACFLAGHILRTIPNAFPIPDIVPEPDGEVALEWEGASGAIFSISVNETGVIAFAGMYPDGTRIHGSEPLRHGNLSRAVMEYIRKAAFAD